LPIRSGDEEVISKRIPIDGYNIYCEIRGSGSHVVLFLPGAMGTCTPDFLQQYKGFDKSKFTLVTWDAPGYGNSRPPARNVRGNYYKRDAESAIKLMHVSDAKLQSSKVPL
jgi:pimeloyl-ACP methyl ester carboxylesterase